jgi:hypothetical protein
MAKRTALLNEVKHSSHKFLSGRLPVFRRSKGIPFAFHLCSSVSICGKNPQCSFSGPKVFAFLGRVFQAAGMIQPLALVLLEKLLPAGALEMIKAKGA